MWGEGRSFYRASFLYAPILSWERILACHAETKLFEKMRHYINKPYRSLIKSLVIEEGVTEVGNNAFQNCTLLESVSFPSGLTEIESCAFQNCAALANIELPDGVKWIGENAFVGTAFYNDEANWDGSVLYIGDYLIRANTDIEGPYDIREGTKVLAFYAFEGCANLTDVTVPDSVISFGNNTTFWNCPNVVLHCSSNNSPAFQYAMENRLQAVVAAWSDVSGTCRNNLTWVLTGDGTLTISGNGEMDISYSYNPWQGYDTFIKKVMIEEGVQSIGYSAFSGCIGLTSVTIPAGVTKIDRYAFSDCRNLKSVTISSGLTTIGENAFNGCSSLTSIILPDSVETIGAQAFYDCTALESVSLPSGLTEIGNSTFYNCSALTGIEIPDGVTSIGTKAFQECTSLESAVLPSGVTEIAEYAFHGCSSLESLTFSEGLQSIGSSAFHGAELE